MTRANKLKRGMTLLEVAAASFVLVVVALGGASYYYYARWAQFRNMQEQAALNLAEVELERWRASGYSALGGYTTPTFLPHGYSFTNNTQSFYKYVAVDGITYRISASLLSNASTSGANYRWEETTGGVTARYRRIVVKVDYGQSYGTSTSVEGRIGE